MSGVSVKLAIGQNGREAKSRSIMYCGASGFYNGIPLPFVLNFDVFTGLSLILFDPIPFPGTTFPVYF